MFGTLNLTQSTSALPWEYSFQQIVGSPKKIRSQTRRSLNQEVACLFLEQHIKTVILQYIFNFKLMVFDSQKAEKD